MVVWGPSAACFVAPALALAVASWMRSAVSGEEEVGDAEEDEGEEEVVVLGDAGCADMRAGAALRVAAACAAATADTMEAISSGSELRAGGCKGSAAIWPPGGGGVWPAAVCGGGMGFQSLPSGLRWAGFLQFARWCVRQHPREETVPVGCIRASGGSGLGLQGCLSGVCVGHWVGWVCHGARGFVWLVCVGSRVRGAARLASRGPLWRACVGFQAGGGGLCSGARGCARWWVCVG